MKEKDERRAIRWKGNHLFNRMIVFLTQSSLVVAVVLVIVVGVLIAHVRTRLSPVAGFRFQCENPLHNPPSEVVTTVAMWQAGMIR